MLISFGNVKEKKIFFILMKKVTFKLSIYSKNLNTMKLMMYKPSNQWIPATAGVYYDLWNTMIKSIVYSISANFYLY